MSIRIDLDEQTLERFRAAAQQRGLSVEAYLRRLAETLAPSDTEPVSHEEFERNLDEVAAGLNLQPLPPDFSRADIYFDHD
jgi:hypothetical protein